MPEQHSPREAVERILELHDEMDDVPREYHVPRMKANRRIIDQVESVITRLERAEALLAHIECKSCGRSPSTSPGWQWPYGEGYKNGHIIPGSVPDLCGPVEFVARSTELEEANA